MARDREMRDSGREGQGSRCGFGDDELDEARRILRRGDMILRADDRGIVAEPIDA